MSTDLITDHLDLWTSAVTYNRSEPELTGVAKLRELILELAVRGKLVPQDPGRPPCYSRMQIYRSQAMPEQNSAHGAT